MPLGRGLGALLSASADKNKPKNQNAAPQPHQLWFVPVAEIRPGRLQPRRQFPAEELNELAESIKIHGILQPLLVAERPDGGYELVAGERRLRAARLAGLPTVPVLVKSLADRERVEVALIENIQRQDLNPLEEAFAYKRLSEEFGFTQEEIARRVGKSRPAIANTVRLLELPQAAQAALESGQISAGQGRALLSVPGQEAQLKLLQELLVAPRTVRELEQAARRQRPVQPGDRRRDANQRYLEADLRAVLGTKVLVQERGGRGSITIKFYSKEEFHELFRRLTGGGLPSRAAGG